MNRRRVPPGLLDRAEIFWGFVDRSAGPSGCHPWTGRIIYPQPNDPRGAFDHGRSWYYAHRVAWLLTYRSWPTPQGNHTCDFGLCCNVAHIYEGTQADNVRDRDNRNRRVAPVGESNGRAVLTASVVAEIRTLYVPGSRGPNSSSALARRFGVHKNTIKLIGRNETWVEKRNASH